MKLSELPIGHKMYTQLGSRVLVVLSRRVEGWCAYIGAVPGESHEREWQDVALYGDKLSEAVAKAVVSTHFHPGFDIDLPYVL